MSQLTPEQAAQLVGGSTSGFNSVKTPTTQQTPQPKGFLSRLGSGISEAFGQRGQNISQSLQADQGLGSKALQTVGQVAGGIGDIATETISEGAQSLPQGVKDVAKKTGVAILQTPIGKVGLDALQGGMESWGRFKEADPETAKNLEAILNIGSLIPIGKGAQVAGKGALKAGETGLELAGKGAKGAGELAQTAKKEVGAGLASIPEQMKTQFKPDADVLPENVAKAKEGIGQKFEKYVTASEQHTKDIKNKRPDAVFGDTAMSVVPDLKNKMNAAAEAKKIALGEKGNKAVRGVDKFVTSFNDKIKSDLGLTYDVNKGVFVDAPGRVSKIGLDPADNKLLKKVYEKIYSLGDNPTVTKVDDVIDSIQDALFKRDAIGGVPVNSRVEGLLKSVTGKLNTVVKKVGGPSYQQANSTYAKMSKVFKELNKSVGKEGVSGASLMKKLFSPAKNEETRRLFNEIKDLTGIDLFQEATFAKFVMESSSDTAQKSLIQAITQSGGLGQTGLPGYLLKKGIDKLTNPIEKARKLIKK